MGLIFEQLGKYVRLVDERNIDMVTESVLGINIDKYFMTSVANVIGTDLSNYKLLRKGRFACNPMHVGRDGRLPVARDTDDAPAIVSPAYFMFEIIDENEIEPEYLMLCFRRPDFDRMCWFRTDASVRGGITWDDVCALTIPVPSISEQRKIVHDYQVIIDRIELLRKINENLEEQAYTLFQQAIDGFEKDGVLSDLAVITMGTSPEGETMNDVGEGEVFYQGRTDFGFRFPTVRLYTTGAVRRAKCDDVLMSVRAPVGDINIAKEDCAIGRGLASIRPKDKCYSFMYYTMKALYYELQRFNDEGTVFGAITKDDLANQKVAMLSSADRKTFDNMAKVLDACICNNEFEVFALQALKDNLLSRLAKGA